MVQSREVVITGAGVVSPIGIGLEAFWTALVECRSGVRPLTMDDECSLSVAFGGRVTDFDPKQYVKPRKSLKIMCREIQTGFAAAGLAMDDAALPAGAVEPERMGVVFGSEMLYGDIAELRDAYSGCIVDGKFDFDLWGKQAMNNLYPLWMLKYLPNMPACHIGIAHDARGPNNSIALAEVSSLLAVSEAASVIGRGMADVMIAGGTGSRLSMTGLVWRSDYNLSHRTLDSASASRPFDASRDGMVNGEGAGAFVMESRQHALARGARVWARVLGWGSAFEPRRNGRLGQGAAIGAAITVALRSAGLQADDVGHVNAHGLSTREDDPVEARAIREALGDVPVTAPKSFFGNLGAGGGAVEMAASVLSLADGRVPVTLNYQEPDSNCPINVIRDRPHQTDKHIAVVLNQTRTGQAVAVVIAGA